MTTSYDAAYWDDATNNPEWPTWPVQRTREPFNALTCVPWNLAEHGVDTADDGGRLVWRFRPALYGVLVCVRHERKLTPMTAYDHEEHIRAIAGDGLIGESFEQRRRRKTREARLRLTVWTLIVIGALAGWSILAWFFVQLFQHLQGR